MDETVLKISAAGLFHDIGKFVDPEAIGVNPLFIRNHADLYQPFFNGRHTHIHSVYTAAFIEYATDQLPPCFNQPGWGEGDSLINLAAKHHRPETPMEWIIAVADRVSSGWDRRSFDDDYNNQIPWKDYKKTRLLTLFEQLDPERYEKDCPGGRDAEREGRPRFCYQLQPISPASIFPVSLDSLADRDKVSAEEEYRRLFVGFLEGLPKLKHKHDSAPLWLEHFDSLLMVHTSLMPSARAGNVKPDVSLYDHSRGTSALATALYLYHKGKETLRVDEVQDYSVQKFLMISGDFYGIQDFIFHGYGASRKYRSKLLRGRSFEVSLFSEFAADMLCRAIGLPFTSVALNAAGRFTVIAPNTETARQAAEQVECRVNDWLHEVTCGQSSMGFSTIEASPEDFVHGRFLELWDSMNAAMERKKASRIDLARYGGVVKGFVESFDGNLASPLCPLCGKRPSKAEAGRDPIVREAGASCGVCRDHVFMGANLVKKHRVAVISHEEAVPGGAGNRLMAPVFGEYQVAFLEEDLASLARQGKLLKHFDLGLPVDDTRSLEVSVRFINGHVPVYSAQEMQATTSSDLSAEGEDPQGSVREGDPKTFEHIAAGALGKDPDGRSRGTEALAVLKADVDHLGILMACGLRTEVFTLSRLATLSRQIDLYFSLFLPQRLKTDRRFADEYTVFAGGDDLFLIGPWNRGVELAMELRDTFSAYTCDNEAIHLSAGISIHKPHTPLDHLGSAVEKALAASKERGRNRLTVFQETATWEEMKGLVSARNTLEQWLDGELTGTATLYRLNLLIKMAAMEKQVVTSGQIDIRDMACTRWRALLGYSVERNIGHGLKGEEKKEAVRTVASTLGAWLQQYAGRVRIPLWTVLYNRR